MHPAKYNACCKLDLTTAHPVLFSWFIRARFFDYIRVKELDSCTQPNNLLFASLAMLVITVILFQHIYYFLRQPPLNK
jgi:hypothetical protein